MKALAIALALTATSMLRRAFCGAHRKPLSGAAKASFLKKCETDAKKSCDAQAAEKKLHGAAQTSFTKKCVSDAVGT